MPTDSKTESQYKIWEPLLLSLMVVVGMIAGGKIVTSGSGSKAFVKSTESGDANRVAELIKFIESKYVDEIDSEILVEKAVKSVIQELDPHSSYISPEDLIDLNEKMEGNFEGIGIEFHRIKDTIAVIYVVPDGPADKAGLEVADRIVMVGDSSITGPGKNMQATIKKLKGKKGTTVEIKVRRPGIDSLLTVRIERDEIPIYSVDAGFMLNANTGYIKLNRFSSTTYKEFMQKLEAMVKDQEMEHLVIDVRQNPGGYLNEAVKILSQLFQEKGKLLVYTEGKNSKRAEYKTTGNPFFEVGQVAVLIDGGSASASEIVAAAVQDHDRGVVLGMPSYGKGLVQEQYGLKNGGALRLTIARYYTPSNRLIQKPYTNYNGTGDSTSGDSTKYYTDNGRVVYGEGGVTPDLEINNAWNWDKAMRNSYDLAIEYIFHRLGEDKTLKKKTLDEYVSTFPPHEGITDEMITYLEEMGNEFSADSMRASSNQVGLMLKAMIGSHFYGRESWYKIMGREDPVIRKAIEVVQADTPFTLKM